MNIDALKHPEFELRPYWWRDYEPKALPEAELPSQSRVVIVGAGYAGIAAAIELTKAGLEATVIDANEPGFGGSTRNGGMVSGGVNVDKRYFAPAMEPTAANAMLADAADSFSLVEKLIAEENIDCGWHKTGRFVGAWCKKHYDDMAAKAAKLNENAQSDAYPVPRERQREEIGSDYYHGGLVVERSAHLHPAKYFKGLLDASQRLGILVHSKTPAERIVKDGAGWRVETPRGAIKAGDVIIATNGYTGDATPQLKRRVVPIGSYIIATEELDPELAQGLSPKNRAFADSRRVLTYYRLSPDGKRMIFGGRAKFGITDPAETAPLLYRFMLDRYPQLKGVKITNAWTGNVAFTLDEVPHMGALDGIHYALGCNGSGIAMMTYLGTQTARRIAGTTNARCAFDRDEFPTHWAYNGNPAWFLPPLGRYFRIRDWLDRKLS